MRVKGKVGVVTGGGRGIGEAIARKLCSEGAAVTIAEIDSEPGLAVADALASMGHRALFIPCDVTVEDQVQALMEKTVAEFGRLDILVNNAGINTYYDAAEMSQADWDHAMGVDLKSAWLCAKHAIPYMKQVGGGSIINIASIHAVLTTKGMFPYAAAKMGLVGLTRSLALDYGADRIRVNAVSPGWIKTRLLQGWFDRQADPVAEEAHAVSIHPIGRLGTSDDIASFVAFLASDEASFATGAQFHIDGGLSIRLPA